MNARRVVLAMAVAMVAMARVLERNTLDASPALARVVNCELTHLVAHSILYGGLAAALAVWWFPTTTLHGPRGLRVRSAVIAGALFLSVAVAQEMTQVLSRHRGPSREELFDLAVDIAGAACGLIVWARADALRRWSVARALGVMFHPALLGPAGAFALLYTAFGDPRPALRWALAVTAAVLPVAALWIHGVRVGWFGDRDLSVRTERPRFLVPAVLAALALAVVTHVVDAPSAVQHMTLAAALASLLVTAATLAGVKVSGHVAVPVGVLPLLEATSHRALWPFAVAALAVAWARVREGRHTPAEVLAGGSLAALSGLAVRAVA